MYPIVDASNFFHLNYNLFVVQLKKNKLKKLNLLLNTKIKFKNICITPHVLHEYKFLKTVKVFLKLLSHHNIINTFLIFHISSFLPMYKVINN